VYRDAIKHHTGGFKMNTKTWIYHTPADEYTREYFTGECEGIPLRTNVAELKGTLVEFMGDTRQEVLDQIKAHLGVAVLRMVN
jgi:hypothetical protein